MIEIYFIRHGQASFGQPDYDCLSSLGQEQARLLGRYLHNTGTRFDKIYCGSLKRHRQTATIALHQINGDRPLTMAIDPDFNEFDSSDLLMNSLCRVIQADPTLAEQMRHIHNQHGAIARIFEIAEKRGLVPADEATRLNLAMQFSDRVLGAITNLVRTLGDHGKTAVFTSGGPTAVALHQALATSREQTIRLGRELRNTSVTVLRHDQGELNLVRFNCVAHLEAQNHANLITYI